jgi:hypothetical protein
MKDFVYDEDDIMNPLHPNSQCSTFVKGFVKVILVSF